VLESACGGAAASVGEVCSAVEARVERFVGEAVAGGCSSWKSVGWFRVATIVTTLCDFRVY